MSPDLLFELAWKSAVLAGVILLILRLMGRRSASERSWLGNLGLLGTLLLPVAVLAVPEWQVQVLKPATPAIAVPQPLAAGAASEPGESSGGVPSDPLSGPSSLSTNQAVALAYAIPAGLLLSLLLLAVLRLQRLRARAEVLVEPRWAVALASAQRRMGFKHGTALLVSTELHSPLSWGVIRPIILLDRHAAADEAQAEAIIAHELAHVARLDWAMLLLGRVATAIFWFNPLVWLLARRCHQMGEEAADDCVLRSSIGNVEYAELLIASARHDNRALFLAANGVAGSGPLTDRVERVLDPSRRRVPAKAGWVAACCAAALLIVAPLSALSPVTERAAYTGGAPSPLEFTNLEVRGPGRVSVRHGPAPRFRLVRGSTDLTDIAVRGRRLVIDACTSSCQGYRPEIEIVTPRLDRVTVEGGGSVQSKGSFPDQPTLFAAISGGGLIRISGIEAARVSATVSGGGTIKTSVRDALEAVIRGDGSIVYWGEPSVASSVTGGGVVVRADDD